ncbi:hypothetical protein VP1G_06400 [Cytospora mali]|uniref:DUF6590 domain-containing protein n=1 Tax=Cytospora mali TaxID=578113 RepID=A0A194V584_CYTMA|nr:hypothetical protein VP1G_06400 [Valsa mali var. pyri (nom. inval.)]
MSTSTQPAKGSPQKKGNLRIKPRLSIRQIRAKNLNLGTDLRSFYNWIGNHTHDQSLGHFGPLTGQGHNGSSTQIEHGATFHAYSGETPSSSTAAKAENSCCSPPAPEHIELIGPTDDSAAECQDPSLTCQSFECEFDIEVSEMTSKNKAMQRTANFVGDGMDLVELGDGEAEHRPRLGGDFFHPGRVINPYSGSNDELDRRTLIVLSTTNNGYVECLALCRHPDHSGEERASFYKVHAAVYNSGDPPPNSGGRRRNEAIEIKFKNHNFKMSDSCYVNFEHTWTLRPDFPVMDLGHVRRDQRRKVLEMHVKIQMDLFNRNIEEHGLGETLKAP